MEGLVQISIGLGLLVSLMFSEFLGLAAGGMVVPGYFALNLSDPAKVLMTIVAAVITYWIVRFMNFFMIIYGRRRTVLMILIGFLVGAVIRNFIEFEVSAFAIDLTVIGYIIPGLIAIWIDRQGLLETVSTLLVSSVLVRMVLILLNGGEVF
ncbi:MAG: poly-gamma-glutamate biosynthesis protein PgsC [Deltaproteobacteria bacterium]|nr:poly-gamma-glutamate biosynthesis protein PgsC [Deltaproteobacteria bacterium]